MSHLQAKNLSIAFGGVQAIDDVSFNVGDRQIVGIIGPNGAGKTTAFNLLTGVYALDKGEVLLDDEVISGLPQYQITRKGLARTFQNIRLFKGLSVLENVMTAADPYSSYGLADVFFYSGRKRKRETEVREMSRQCLDLVGLAGFEQEKPENLPYGQQRKLELARALACKPKVLLLDEPAAGLNPSEVRDFIRLIQKLHDQFSLSVLVIEHRMEVIMTLCSNIYVLNFGKLLAQGTPSEIQNNREVTEAYIGEEDEACLL
ncbi:MAG: ABC transporter ATP-binding protein [Veillonellaceae bacterium]|nr:ABC transporter ATP-binding protein [Veillonellaceae bacterium]